MSDTSPSDKDGKALNVSEEEHPSSSSPSSMATAETGASNKRPLQISEEENADSSSKKQEHDQGGPSSVNPRRHSGFTFELARQLAQMREDLANREDEDWVEPEGDIFLFETEVTLSNRLLIPVARAIEHFPVLLALGKTSKPHALHLTVPQIKEWIMPVIRYDDEDAFMFIRYWPEFIKFHNLKTSDKIRFYDPIPRLHVHHYLITFVKGEENVAQMPEFRKDNFLFQIEMSPGDVGYSNLFISSNDVRNHFPEIDIDPLDRMTEIIKFTDAQNKDWYMDVMRYNSDFYMIIEGWDGFVTERNLKAKDLINFYAPVQPSHKKHFLIERVRNDDENHPTQQGSTKNEGDEGKQGDRGGPRTGSDLADEL
ncbi:uncharacterized protein LOC130762091 [Actinidia eriantha]|uniref:uncharacterized protein LOC130762091 n=1 Tax=Actinidia eriantha TaxID=165200 RepID=UPI00258CFB0F|nr:uncharacterized protein LOC130762091 [Actinidia eriantha]XP_057473718.1 uncharacterized protein LOC130762091 [Actinidia eriantha]